VTVAEIVGDTTPQLGGTLDCQNNNITLGSGTVTIDSDGTLATLNDGADVACEVINSGAGKGGLRADFFEINDQTAFNLTLTGTPTADRTITFPDSDGTVVYAGTASHDGFSDFVAAEHVDWAGASAGTIHPTNLPSTAKSITIETATATEDIGAWFQEEAMTISKIALVRVGGTSCTITLRHDPDRSAVGNEVVTGGTAVTSTTTGNIVTSFNDATVPAASWCWWETTAQVGNPQIEATVIFREDA
jgi:hypothetical protein